MKTQYRLIKKYPGSPKVGDIVKGYGRDGWYSKGEGHSTYDWRQVVYYPEYWEEVVEPDYEILSFKQDSGITDLWTKFYTDGWGRNVNGQCATSPYTTEEILSNKLYTIHSVKRLSDGEVFTVGDRVKIYTHGPIKTIETITTNSIRSTLKEGVWFTYNSGSSHMDHAIKQTQPIFLTHDGKGVFEGDKVWYVNKESLDFDHFTTHANVTFRSDINAYFLTEEAAQDYIHRNRVLFITEDGVKIFAGSTYWCINTAPHLWSLFEQTAKERTMLNKTVKAFSTYETAEKYIIENKPALSINEFWEITWMSTSGFNKHTYMKNLVKQRLNLK